MNLQVLPQFVTVPEQQALLAWADTAELKVRNQPDFLLTREQNEGVQPTTGERKSEFIHEDGPVEFYDIQDRLTDKFNLRDKMPDGRQGKCIIHELDSETPRHIDYFKHIGPGYFRVTVVVQKPEEGGILVVGDDEIDLPERSCVAFYASEVHAVRLVTAGKRIVFVFGWKTDDTTRDTDNCTTLA